MPDVRIDLLNYAIGRLAPDERLALEQIAQTADLVEVEGCTPYLLIPTTPALLDVLAALGAEAMDREPDTDYETGGDLEPNTGDDESTGDEEHSHRRVLGSEIPTYQHRLDPSKAGWVFVPV